MVSCNETRVWKFGIRTSLPRHICCLYLSHLFICIAFSLICWKSHIFSSPVSKFKAYILFMSLPQNPFTSASIPSMKKSPSSSSSLEKRGNPIQIENVDRISNLPDDVLLKILGSMPTEKAIQTSLLSKRWEGVWKQMSCLFFDMRNNLKAGVPLAEQSSSIAQLITKVLSFLYIFTHHDNK